MLNFILLQIANQDKFLFASEKIYTVLTVVLIIFSITILYLLRMDMKVSKLEQLLSEKNKNENGN